MQKLSSKLIAFPIFKRKWAYFAMASMNEESNTANNLSWKYLSENIMKKKDFAEKTEFATDFLASQMHRQWKDLESSKSSIKKWIHTNGSKLLSRVKPSEIFLKSIPKDARDLQIIFPQSQNPKRVSRLLWLLAKKEMPFHQKYFYGSAILVPFASILSILPLPNILLFWILFRAYSHYCAFRGSQNLLSFMEIIKIKKNEKRNDGMNIMHEIEASSKNISFLPSRELDELTMPSNGGMLCDSAIEKISKMYEINQFEIKNWEKQPE